MKVPSIRQNQQHRIIAIANEQDRGIVGANNHISDAIRHRASDSSSSSLSTGDTYDTGALMRCDFDTISGVFITRQHKNPPTQPVGHLCAYSLCVRVPAPLNTHAHTIPHIISSQSVCQSYPLETQIPIGPDENTHTQPAVLMRGRNHI